MSYDDERQPADVEKEFKDAEKDLLKMISATEAVAHVRTMSRCFSEHAVAIREDADTIRHMQSDLHSADHQSAKAVAAIREAAAIRAKIAKEAIAALAGMLPEAKRQAKKGKPALLRMILRASK